MQATPVLPPWAVHSPLYVPPHGPLTGAPPPRPRNPVTDSYITGGWMGGRFHLKEKKRLRLLSVNEGRRALAPEDQDTLMVHKLQCSAHQ
jgi:hypothetical protein